jgi:transcriptional regulator with XRE-family HTH domain
LGETQEEFAERFDVDTSTVSRWERGRVAPGAKAYAKIRRVALRADGSHELIRASRVYKFLASFDDLLHPVVISRGVAEVLAEVGYSSEDFLNEPEEVLYKVAPGSPGYETSTVCALTTIQNDPRWRRGEIAYAEGHAFSGHVQQWVYGLVAPLADMGAALVEAVIDDKATEGFWVKFEPLDSQESRT